MLPSITHTFADIINNISVANLTSCPSCDTVASIVAEVLQLCPLHSIVNGVPFNKAEENQQSTSANVLSTLNIAILRPAEALPTSVY